MCTLVGHGKHTAPPSPPAKPRKGTVVAFPMGLAEVLRWGAGSWHRRRTQPSARHAHGHK